VGHLVIRFLQRLNVGPERFDFGRLIVIGRVKGLLFFRVSSHVPRVKPSFGIT